MNFDRHLPIYSDEYTENQRRDVIRAALVLCDKRATDEDIDGILTDLRDRYGIGIDADRRIVSALNDEYFTAYFKRKLDESNREQFKNELALRVWETVKGMTWFTDAQKEIPEDLGARVKQKRIDEETSLAEMRRAMFL